MNNARKASIPEKIIVSNHVGEKLVGILEDAGSAEIVIICHGSNSSKDCKLIANLASSLGRKGLSNFRFDFSGNGESEGDFQFSNYYKEVDDLHSVVLYWIRKGREVKAIVGHSKGGTTVLLYASIHREVRTVVNASGRLDLAGGLKERFGEDFMERIKDSGFVDVKDPSGDGKPEFRITMESLTERMNLDLRKAVKMIPADVRVLTVHGSEDKAVAVENAYGCDEMIRNHTLQIINGADHMYNQHETVLQEIVIDFMLRGA